MKAGDLVVLQETVWASLGREVALWRSSDSLTSNRMVGHISAGDVAVVLQGSHGRAEVLTSRGTKGWIGSNVLKVVSEGSHERWS